MRKTTVPENIVQECLVLYKSGITQFEIGQKFHLNKNQIQNIINKNLSKEEKSEIISNRKHKRNSIYLNKKFNRLLINKSLTTKTGQCFECLCDCGKIIIVRKYDVISNNTKSCGCLQSESYTSFGDLSGKYFGKLQISAMQRHIDFDLKIEDAWDLFLKQNKKCALSGHLINIEKNYGKDYKKQTASLDRINSNLHYFKDNVMWVHKDINKMKMDLDKDLFLEYCKNCYLNTIKRPSFNQYFMRIAFDVSLRSDDPNIKHGSVIVNNSNHIIGTGYNCTIRGIDMNEIPYEDRDKKRLWMIHSEENAILNCTINPLNCGGAKIYVTGLPCVNCLQRILNFGIKEIYYADRIGTITENPYSEEMRAKILKMFPEVKVIKMTKEELSWI